MLVYQRVSFRNSWWFIPPGDPTMNALTIYPHLHIIQQNNSWLADFVLGSFCLTMTHLGRIFLKVGWIVGDRKPSVLAVLLPQHLGKTCRRVWNQDDSSTMACCMLFDSKRQGDRWFFVQEILKHVQLQRAEILDIAHLENDITDRLVQYCSAIWKWKRLFNKVK